MTFGNNGNWRVCQLGLLLGGTRPSELPLQRGQQFDTFRAHHFQIRLLQPCVRRCRETRPERSPASFDPTFAAVLSGRGFVGRFLGLACGCLRFAPAQAQEHPDKTLVGRISRGFDFLGDDFSPAGMTGMSRRSVEKFAQRVALLAEQGADAVGIGQTVRPWLRWTSAGLDGCLRWTETQLPLGCESVSGMLLPGRLALDDPDTMLSGPPAVRSHATPAAVASCGQPRGFGAIKKAAPERVRGGLYRL